MMFCANFINVHSTFNADNRVFYVAAQVLPIALLCHSQNMCAGPRLVTAVLDTFVNCLPVHHRVEPHKEFAYYQIDTNSKFINCL